MTGIDLLKQAKSLTDIAKLVGFTPAGLSYILYRMPESAKYRAFEIPKRSGGTRTIKAPMRELALLQSRLNTFLGQCAEELARDNPRFWAAAHGFRKGRTIVTNANAHRSRRYVFNVDIANFFDSINFGRVRGVFIKDRAFNLEPTVATIIAQIACFENALPQGSPCSPIISNFVAGILDARLLRLAKHARCTYTRYADDLTFSTNERLFPTEIARELAGPDWCVGPRLSEVVEASGFQLNPGKTRMSLRRSRQTVTGLVVNEKPNIKQKYYRDTRSMCSSLFSSGKWHHGTGVDEQQTSNLRPLEGRLAHIYYVKARHDRSQKQNKHAEYVPPTAPVELYRKFLFYKHFVANDLPTVVTEGVSDITYLKCAIRSLSAKFPSLIGMSRGKLKVDLQFLNPTGTSRSVLNLGHGASGQASLIQQYSNRLKNYKNRPLAMPVIILCDNDDGPKEVFKNASGKTGKTISKSTTDPFYYLGDNLYLVKVPENGTQSRDMEDMFPASVLDELLENKPFNKKKEHGDGTAYGKVIFAEKVVRPKTGTSIFNDFEDLLTRIIACIAHYAAIRATKAAASSPAPALSVPTAAAVAAPTT
ncbi:retron Ec67 family RNA-directed DNA polymerase/endonuclease [Ciceribacter sp. L1K23]|uniref:retron Ec67 family RNA-directed DNA polymerase/endonuclease n=1 Tax=Ciceribacter sp. L1K23 TaxID=2820276 RepID=UPI001B834614|nr:retron Ec67 family RNA-directed DNA polymerase/endonuclease [Ciceribacter sp. L1K23]MBR0558437.1 retron Ec67 family RNA-directed DNA polymerase/endonuclease [Ciceribacter sp. L1K23]